MISWESRIKNGCFACALYGSLLVRAGQIWECANLSCKDNPGSHPDIPVEQSREFAGWESHRQVIASTASVYLGTASGTGQII